GEVPPQCQGCFKLEESGCSSPRQDYINRFGNVDEVRIKYLDVTFNNDCNLECMMCSPLYSYKLNKLYHRGMDLSHSSTWQVDLDSTTLSRMLPTLEVITLTGGEPFVSKKILDFIKNLSGGPFARNLTLRVFTNLSHMSLEIINTLKKFKKVELLLSIDSVEENYEFIRYPASWKTLVNNIELLNAHRFPHLDIHLHCVLMATNWLSIGKLIKFYHNTLGHPNLLPIFVEIDTPSFLHPGVLPEKDFNEGLQRIEGVLDDLEAKFPIRRDEILELRVLLKKIASKRDLNLYLQYKVFVAKLSEARAKVKHDK
ncbi:MAG: twitch domain-containing radical SAM protein, partial [Bacteriovoracaceae bacterium]